MKTLLTYSSLIFAAFFIHVQTTDTENCQTVDAPRPTEVDIINCTTPPCVFYINATGIVNLKFTAPSYLENISPKAVAHILGIDIPYPLDQKDACDGITNTPCPLAEGEYIEYTFSMFVLPIFPEVPLLNLEFSLLDEDKDKEPFVCFRVDLTISKS